MRRSWDDAATHAQRQAAARRIQKVWRGWRTRRRVVCAVRTELSLFMAEMEEAVEMERRLLGLPKPQRFSWGANSAETERAAVNMALRLPRIEDDVFGWTSSFPPPDAAEVTQSATRATGREDSFSEKGVETDPIQHSPLDSDENVHRSHPEGAESESVSCSSSARSPADALEDDEISPSQTPISDRILGNVPEGEPTSDLEKSGTILAGGKQIEDPRHSKDASRLSVEEILATHSKAEIRRELEWARHALKDRLQYLRRSTSSLKQTGKETCTDNCELEN